MKRISRRDIYLLAFFAFLVFWWDGYCKGVANAEWIADLHNLDIPWQEARHFNVVVTTTDVAISLGQATMIVNP